MLQFSFRFTIVFSVFIGINFDLCLSRKIPKTENSSKGDERVECKDENGNSVPWFIAYKLPKLKTASGSTFKQGSGYSYIVPGYKAWKPSDKPIGSQNSIVGQTLKPYLDSRSRDGLLSIVYNDQPSDDRTFSGGAHSKGIVLSKGSGGLWLMHSVPRFPYSLSPNDFYPSNGLINAQMFLCLTLTTEQIDSLGDTFVITRPNVGNYSLPESLSNNFPKMKTYRSTKRYKGIPLNKVFNLEVGQLDFKIFAKSPKYDAEIYYDWLAPTFKSDLEVQSWLAGRGVLKSDCSKESPYKVYNIAEKKVDGNDFGRNDHSKWAVTPKDSNEHWVCISDINRMNGQRDRGGASVCASNDIVWTAFNTAVIDLQPCERTTG